MANNESDRHPMTIAFDYDGTVTADPAMWASVLQTALQRGHEVICVACRRSGRTAEARMRRLLPKGVKVYFASENPTRGRARQLELSTDI